MVQFAPSRHDTVDHEGSRGPSGLTLMELLIVLFLMALVAAVAAPSFERLYTSIQKQTDRNHILNQIAGLGPMALRHGRSYVVTETGSSAPESRNSAEPPANRLHDSSDEPYTIDIPERWSIKLSRPLVIRANGVCLGAEFTVLHDGEVEFQAALEPPFCRIATHE